MESGVVTIYYCKRNGDVLFEPKNKAFKEGPLAKSGFYWPEEK